MGGGASAEKKLPPGDATPEKPPPVPAPAPKTAEPPAASPRVPLQLKRLPRAQLRAVSEALSVLIENGLSDQVHIEETMKALQASLASNEAFISTYMEMCDWARTPNLWAKASGRPDPWKGFKLAKQTKDQMKKALEEMMAQQAKAREAACASAKEGEDEFDRSDLELKKARHIRESPVRRGYVERVEEGKARNFEKDWEACFERWWAAQLANLDDMNRLADPSYVPKSLGVGPGVFFMVASNGTGAPPVKVKRRIVQVAKAEPQATGNSGKAAFAAALVHVGAEGCGMGAALWNRLMKEHQVSSEGVAAANSYGQLKPHFNETRKGRLVPRAIFVSDGFEGLTAARQLGCFAPDDLIGEEGFEAETLFDLYRPTDDKAKLLFDASVESLRQQIERMEGLRSILLTHSAIEACGTGLGMRLLEHMSIEYGKASRQALSMTLPKACTEEGMRSLVNLAVMSGVLMEHTDCHVLMDHAALQGLCTGTRPCGLGMSNPTWADHHDLVARVVSTWTSPIRMGPSVSASEGSLRLDMQKLATNLVPYPRIGALVASYAPLHTQSKADFAMGTSQGIVGEALRHGCLSSVKMQEGKLIAVALSCRNIQHGTVTAAVADRRYARDVQFCDWSPTGFLLGCHSDPTAAKDGECSSLINTTAVGGLLEAWLTGLDQGEGWRPVVEKLGDDAASEVSNAVINMECLRRDYEEVAAETCEGEGEEEEEDY